MLQQVTLIVIRHLKLCSQFNNSILSKAHCLLVISELYCSLYSLKKLRFKMMEMRSNKELSMLFFISNR